MSPPAGEAVWQAFVATWYGRSGFSIENPPGAAALAGALLGPAAIRYVAPLELDQDAVLRQKPWGMCIEVRANLPAPLENYATARALVEWLLPQGTQPPSEVERSRQRLVGDLLVPKPALAKRYARHLGSIEALARAFLVPQALIALRIGECFRVPIGLVWPQGQIERRGPGDELPDDAFLRKLARSSRTAPPFRRVVLTDDPGFVVIQVAGRGRKVRSEPLEGATKIGHLSSRPRR